MTRLTIAVSALLATIAAGSPAATGIIPANDALARSVEKAATAVARARVLPPDRFELISSRFAGTDPLPVGQVDLVPLEADGPNASGIVRVKFRVLVDGARRGIARASVRGEVRGPAVVAAATLARGVVVPRDSIRVIDADLTRLGESPLRDPDEVIGLVPVRTLGEGRVLTPGLLAPVPVVRRGETVDVTFERGGLSVTVEGMARRDGAPGDVVPAENTATGALLQCEVQPDGSLRVVRGPRRKRS